MIIVLAASLQAQWSNDPNNNLIVGYGLDPHICSDSAGGCYITYNYETTWYPQKLAVERLDKYGYKPWGTMRQILGELPEQWQAEIVEDGEGGVIVSYQDHEWIPPSYFNSKVRVQKVDSNGNFLWGQTGVRVTLSETNQGSNLLVSDGEGGCVVVWQYYDEPISINRIDRFGQRVWGDSGVVLSPTAINLRIIKASDGKYYVQVDTNVFRINQNGEIINQYSTVLWNIIPDPDGGVVLSGTVGNINNLRLVTQRNDSLGNNLWQEPYVEIADSLYINAIINVKRIDNYYYYTWHGRKNGIDLVAQYQAFRSDGTKLFNQGSIPISNYPVDALLGEIIPSDSGTFVLIWQDNRPGDGVFGQRRDTLNNKLWNSVDVSIDTGIYSVLYVISDGMGGAIGGGWQQSDFSIRAFKVSKNGILGEIITSVDDKNDLIFPEEFILYQNYPNPSNSSTIIKYQIPKVVTHRDASPQLVKLIVYDVLGNEVVTLVNEEKLPGVYEVEFDASSLASGMYLYKIQAGQSFIQTKKMILLK